ncbi:GFA family protein [Bowmanella dokdonensis]|uniref:GFA family protein n=1 Tax=Bowmanella dokdonensis TaxID=751969 RepID=A0A939DS88_9ALTE|nr:GFA family protein [Bowmanella dokdonensis]MBN7826961.1 GFA family protein [Bowmanella dokdonensis]
MENTLTGQCLCGQVRFTLRDNFRNFHLCHCKQCQQLTGSAFAANLFTDMGNIEWTQGRDRLTTYRHPSRDFSHAFCKSCGSALPYINKRNTALVVPAGSLNDMPKITPQANIFVTEQVCWLEEGRLAERFEGFAG